MTMMDRRGFLGLSMLFVGGAVVSCSTTDPMAKKNQPPAASGAKVTLNQWYHQYGEAGTQQAVQRYAAEYTKANPGVAINVNWIAGEYETRLNAALLTAEAPDVFEIGDFRYEMVKKGQIAPLDDIYGDARSDFNKAGLDNLTIDGKIYGVKMIDDIMMLYYRRSLVPTPPQTYDDLVALAKQLTTKKQKGLFIANDGIGDAPYLLLWSNGGDLIKDGKVALSAAESVEAVGALKRLHDDRSLLLGFTTDWFDPGAISQNAAAMQWCGLWAMPAIQKALGDDFGVIPWPAFKAGGTAAARLGGWNELVNAKSAHVDEAKKYVQWLWIQQTELQKDWCVKYGFHVPPRAGIAAQTPELSTGAPKEAADISAKYGKAFPNVWSQAMGTSFTEAVTSIVRKGADPASVLGEAATRAQADLDKQLS
ncbi:ABC transporter substrate-binding protein [Nonomuraea endophytica]|uniref:ABC transporter substrate-binding protein n=1 Tax=Nonomuraea endophytica TaxID=714136 RepID=UPI0037CB68E7